MKKIIFLSISLFALLLLAQINVFACDCPSRTFAEALEKSTAVFSGKVIAQEYQKITDASDKDFGAEVLTVKLKVDKWWKGSGDSDVVLKTLTVRNGWIRRNSCDFFFKAEESYLVYAGFYKDWLRTGACSRTKELTGAGEDVKELGEGFLPKTDQKVP